MRGTGWAVAAVAMLALGTACSGSSTTAAPAPTVAASATAPAVPQLSSPPAATTAPAPGPSPVVTTTTTPVCATAQLRLVVRDGDGGAGQFHQPLVLVNTGPRCSMHGYPGVSFVGAAGRQLGSPAAQTSAQVRRVFLAPQARASAVLTYSNAEAYPDSTCRPQQAARVRVYPPGSRVALEASDPLLVCSAPGSGQLHIGPMQAGG